MTFFERIAAFFASIPSEIYVLLISVLPIIELRGAIPVGAGLGLPFYLNYPLAVFGNLLPIPFILLFIPKVLDFLARFKAFRPMVEWLRSKADKHSARVLGKEKKKKKSAPDGSAVVIDEDNCKVSASSALDGGLSGAEAAVGKVTPASEASATGADEAVDAENKFAPNVGTADGLAEAKDICGEAGEGDLKDGTRRMSRGVFIALMLFVAIPLPGTGAWTGGLVSSLFGLPKGSSMLSITLGVLISGVIMCLASYGVIGFLSIFL